ncbi:MAG: D-alanyl-D-alanine carboxypeptidase, partial [Oscillospiraceae bacterium]|nr:D-alanyl-D-alanine carboxypeptidase [Oscillospiraceae bacterium]
RFVQPVLAEEKSVVVKKSEAGSIESSVELIETAKAPVAEGDILGRLTLTLGGEELASVDLVAAGSVNKLGFFDVFLSLLGKLF